MDKFAILVVMMVCLFGPMTIFALFGARAIETLGRRPSEGSRVMIPFILKMMGVSFLCLVLLMVLLKVFGPDSRGMRAVTFSDFEWRLAQSK